VPTGVFPKACSISHQQGISGLHFSDKEPEKNPSPQRLSTLQLEKSPYNILYSLQ
jgi:hypothetical protein